MHALIHLRQAPALKVFLTATLIPDHQRVLAESFGISLARTLVLRSPTARPNHQFQIAALSLPHSPFTVGIQLASLLLQKWGDDQSVRGIIFVRSLKKLAKVSDSSPFLVCTYHGSMSDQEKETQLTSWLSDEYPAKWMISTTALLHGVDYPRVDAVIFLECPFGLYDFVQGAGRAGRSGQESLVAVLHNGVPSVPFGDSQYGCRAEMERIITTASCRRAGISKVMDVKETSCFQLPDSLLCDFCDGHIDPLVTAAINMPPPTPAQPTAATQIPTPQSPPQAPPTALISAFSAQANTTTRKRHGESIMELMERFSGCFVCRISSGDHRACHEECGNSGRSGCTVNRHRVFDCSSFPYKNGWMDWKKTFRWPKDVRRCYYCGFPDAVVGFSHRTTDNKENPGICRFSDTAVSAAWHILNTPELFRKLRKELGFAPGADSKSSFATWLVQYGSESEDIRLLSVFSWLCRQYYPTHFHSG